MALAPRAACSGRARAEVRCSSDFLASGFDGNFRPYAYCLPGLPSRRLDVRISRLTTNRMAVGKAVGRSNLVLNDHIYPESHVVRP